MFFQRPSRLMFLCKLRVGKTKLRDLGMGYFKRQRDAHGNWDGWTWQLKTLTYTVDDIPTSELPLIENGKRIKTAVIQRNRNGRHRIACRVGRTRNYYRPRVPRNIG